MTNLAFPETMSLKGSIGTDLGPMSHSTISWKGALFSKAGLASKAAGAAQNEPFALADHSFLPAVSAPNKV